MHGSVGFLQIQSQLLKHNALKSDEQPLPLIHLNTLWRSHFSEGRKLTWQSCLTINQEIFVIKKFCRWQHWRKLKWWIILTSYSIWIQLAIWRLVIPSKNFPLIMLVMKIFCTKILIGKIFCDKIFLIYGIHYKSHPSLKFCPYASIPLKLNN